MARDSKIEWTHHTFNTWWGCIRVSPACKHCYADTWAKRLGLQLWNHDSPRRFFGDAHWREPLNWNRDAAKQNTRARVFCSSMADVFENLRELDPWREKLWGLIEATPNLDWLLLTKRIDLVKQLAPWSGRWPSNIWLGSSMENQTWFNKRVDHLLQHDAVVRFVSAEPLLSAIQMRPYLARQGSGINWVIAGGESGPESRITKPRDVEFLRDQCMDADVAFHFKQWGHWAPQELIEESIAARKERKTVQGVTMVKVGKAQAGRILDGQTWDQLPMIA
jgi:protein gp37